MTDILRLSLPITLWLTSFSALYGLHGLTCARGLDPRLLLLAYAVAVILQAVPLALLATRRFGATTPFLRRTSLTLAIVAFIAAVWTLGPVAVLPACR
jgi:hypothetical protein